MKVSSLGWLCLAVLACMLLTTLLAWIYCLMKGSCIRGLPHTMAAGNHCNTKELRVDLEADDEDFRTVDDETHWSILSSPTQDTPLLQGSASPTVFQATVTPHGAHNTLTCPQSPQDASSRRCAPV